MPSKLYKWSYVVVIILNLIWIINRYVFSIREAFITILISFIILAVGCLLRLTGKSVDFHTAVRQLVRAALIYYCFVLYAVLISKNLVFQRDYGNILNLIPFRTISQELDGFSLRLFGNLVGNIILFIPLGIMLPAVKDGFQKFYICIPVICVFSLFVEMIQYLTRSGSADIDDMILNTVGGLIGFTLYKIVSQMIRTGRRSSSSG